MSFILKAIASIDRAVSFLFDIIAFVLLRLVFVDPDWVEVRQRYKRYDVEDRRSLNPEHARFLFDRAHIDSDHTDSKVRQLLTLSAALTPLALLLAQRSDLKWLGLLLVGSLIVAVYLCLTNLEVRQVVSPTAESKDDDPHDEQWAWDLHCSTKSNQAIHRIRVDFYRAARRYFLLAFLLAPVLALRPRATDATERDTVVQQDTVTSSLEGR